MRGLFFKRINPKSQIAVIITLVIAVIILFAYVFINLVIVSNSKMLTSQIADRGALYLGSQLGSLSNLLINQGSELIKKEPLGEWLWKCDANGRCCGPNWDLIGPLLMVLGGTLLATIPSIWPVGMLAGIALIGIGWSPLSAEISKYMSGGFAAAVPRFSTYNNFREATIMSMLTSSVSADRSIATRQGDSFIFNDNEGNYSYDLTQSPLKKEIQRNNPSYLPRFTAWYYAKRFPLVSDEALNQDIKNFIDVLAENTYFPQGAWSSDKWQYEKLSFFAEGLITCDANCPDWVLEPSPEYQAHAVSVVGPIGLEDSIDNANFLLNEVLPGFLTSKFIQLCHRLLDKGYDLSAASPSGYISRKGQWDWGEIIVPLPGYDDKPIYQVADFLKGFLIRSMELFNLPVSQRLPTINEWLPLWYDSVTFKDLYNQLTQVHSEVSGWITRLNEIDTGDLIPEIKEKHGECTWGWGPEVNSFCYLHYDPDCDPGAGPGCGHCCCGDDPCSPCCCTCCNNKLTPCAWEGTYYTCCQSPPVCSNGDLYSTIPGWCPNGDHAGCSPSCSCNINDFNCDGNSKFFQGQLAWNETAGPTEVAQAVYILESMNEKIDAILAAISALHCRAETVLNRNQEIKKEAVYTWIDYDPNQRPINYHLVRVKVDDYPTRENFPHRVTTKDLFDFRKCTEVVGAVTGSFSTAVARYDTDIPSAWWNFRRTKMPLAPAIVEKNKQTIKKIQDDILSDGKLDDVSGLNDVLSQAIESRTQGTYGPQKSNISITREK